jgi:hypothetical protein
MVAKEMSHKISMVAEEMSYKISMVAKEMSSQIQLDHTNHREALLKVCLNKQ